MHAEYCDIHVTSVIKCTIAFQLTFAHMRPAIKLHFFFLTLMKLHFRTFVLLISVYVEFVLSLFFPDLSRPSMRVAFTS